MEIPDRFQSPCRFFFRFASDFVCVGCLVVGFFALVLPCTRVLQSPVGFRGCILHVGFWDALKSGGVLIGFEKLQCFWSCYGFGRISSS